MDVSNAHIVFAYSEKNDPLEVMPARLEIIDDVLLTQFYRRVFEKLGTKVLSGPFAGMELSQEYAWNDGNVVNKLLGIYEIELHAYIERAIARNPKRVVNIGCAEGYYANGFAKRLPDAQVRSYDILPEVLKLATANAVKNSLTNASFWLVDGTHYNFVEIAKILEPAELVFMDAEAGERAYLNEVLQPIFSRFDLIVECHDFLFAGISADLISRFQETHTVEVIKPSQEPVRQGFPRFDLLGQTMPMITVRDFHAEETVWLACWSKERDQTISS